MWQEMSSENQGLVRGGPGKLFCGVWFYTELDGSRRRVLNGRVAKFNLCFQKITLAAVPSVCTILVQ